MIFIWSVFFYVFRYCSSKICKDRSRDTFLIDAYQLEAKVRIAKIKHSSKSNWDAVFSSSVFCCVPCIVLHQNKRTLTPRSPAVIWCFINWMSFGDGTVLEDRSSVLPVSWCFRGNMHGKRKNSFYTTDQCCWAQASCGGNAKNSNKKLGKLPLSHSSSHREPLSSDPFPRRPHASCYTARILLRSVVTVFPLYFLLIWPFCQTAVGMRTILCTSTFYHGRGVRVLILGQSQLIWAS